MKIQEIQMLENDLSYNSTRIVEVDNFNEYLSYSESIEDIVTLFKNENTVIYKFYSKFKEKYVIHIGRVIKDD